MGTRNNSSKFIENVCTYPQNVCQTMSRNSEEENNVWILSAIATRFVDRPSYGLVIIISTFISNFVLEQFYLVIATNSYALQLSMTQNVELRYTR
jgi:hypothetical protein